MQIKYQFQPEEIHQLEDAYRSSKDVRQRTWLHGVLLLAEGRTPQEVAQILKVDDATVYRWFERYRRGGLAGLKPQHGGGRQLETDEAFQAHLYETARRRPRALDQPFSMWTLQRMADYMAAQTGTRVSYETIRRLLKRAGIVFSQPQHKVSSPDPDYAVKKKRSKNPETT
jgi:transposase